MEKTDNNSDRFQITELFMANADVNRCFYGCIKRLQDKDGKPYVFSRIVMPEGILYASASEQQELQDNMDKMCIHIMDRGLHDDTGKFIEISDGIVFIN